MTVWHLFCATSGLASASWGQFQASCCTGLRGPARLSLAQTTHLGPLRRRGGGWLWLLWGLSHEMTLYPICYDHWSLSNLSSGWADRGPHRRIVAENPTETQGCEMHLSSVQSGGEGTLGAEPQCSLHPTPQLHVPGSQPARPGTTDCIYSRTAFCAHAGRRQ